jgi:hypothetical protein
MARATCTVADCSLPVHARLLCKRHYQRWSKHGDPLVGGFHPRRSCMLRGCERVSSAKGYCDLHYKRSLRTGDPSAPHDSYGRRLIEFEPYVSPPQPPDRRPPRLLREELQRWRRLDSSFWFAWREALSVALRGLGDEDRDDWASIFDSHKVFWGRCYFRLPVPVVEPLAVLRPDDDVEPWSVQRRGGSTSVAGIQDPVDLVEGPRDAVSAHESRSRAA